jgi:hypothetical protein
MRPSYATTVTFDFTGSLYSVDPTLAGSFAPGDSVVGSYTFDTDLIDQDPSDPTVGIYDSSSAYSVSAGSFTSTGSGYEFKHL